MNNKFCIIGLTVILLGIGIHKLSAQSTAENFYDTMLISDEIKTEESAESAKDSASQLLNAKPKEIKVDSPLLRSHQKESDKANLLPPPPTKHSKTKLPHLSAWHGEPVMTK